MKKHGGHLFLKTYDSYDTHGHLYLILIAWEREEKRAELTRLARSMEFSLAHLSEILYITYILLDLLLHGGFPPFFYIAN